MATIVNGSIAGNLLAGSFDPGLSFGSTTIRSPVAIPNLPAIPFLNGTGVGQLSLMAFTSGTLTNVTPGTTDTATIDLTTITMPNGAAMNPTKVNATLVLNDSTTEGNVLLVGNAATPFDDWLNGVTAAVLKVLNGHVDPTDSQARPGGALLWGFGTTSYAVSGTHKLLKLYSGSAVSLPYRVAFFGRP